MDDLAIKLRLLAQDIDDAQMVIGHIEARRGVVARKQAGAGVMVPDSPTPLALPAPVDVPSWARPGGPPLTHWQRFGLTYLFCGVVGFTLTALVVITQGVTTMLGALVPYLAWIVGLPAALALVVALGALCSRGRSFTFQGTGRLF